MATIDAKQLEGDLLDLLKDEGGRLKDELTPERRERLAKTLKALAQLTARAHAGEDVEVLLEIVGSTLDDYKAVAALVLVRAAERLLVAGADVGARVLGALGRGLLAGLGLPIAV